MTNHETFYVLLFRDLAEGSAWLCCCHSRHKY